MRRIHILPKLAGAALAVLAAPALAQSPTLTHVYPPGIQAGQKAAVTLAGANLQEATRVLVEGAGVEFKITDSKNAGALAAEITVAAGVPAGVREVRVISKRGTSNAGRIWVGAYPEVNEAESNNSFAAPQKLERLPVTINGQINGGEDLDVFTFNAAAGETMVFDLIAYRLVSPLDGYLELSDARGRTLKIVQEGFDRDPRLIYAFKTAGTYAIQVRDAMFRGGANFVYKLVAGRVPAVTAYLPLGGKRGEKVDLQLEGVNLGGMSTYSVQMPASGDRVDVMPATPDGPISSPLSLTIGDTSEAVELEPNDQPAQATGIPGGVTVMNGRMHRKGDVDLYRFKPGAAGNLSFQVVGRRMGSRIDSILKIRDAMGKELQSNDDAIGKDSRIVMGVQAGAEYLVEVRNLDLGFGGDCFYRLEIAPPGGQDFSLAITPDSINVGQLASAQITVTVTRMNGFSGAIALRLENLPAGITPSPADIPAGQNTVLFTLTAAQNADPGAMRQIRVVGTATIDAKPVERLATPAEVFPQPLANNNQTATRTTAFLMATPAIQPPYVLDIEPKAITAKRGTTVEIKVKAIRQMGQNAQIAIPNPAGLPANVAPAPQPIAQNANEAVLKLTINGNAPLVTQNVIISGNMSNNIQVAPALRLTVTQ